MVVSGYIIIFKFTYFILILICHIILPGHNLKQYFVNLFLYTFSANNATEIFESFDSLSPAALISSVDNSTVCGRNPIMGTIVADAAPYLYPFIIEYSLIGAAVIYVMWKHIGRYPRYVVSFYPVC